MYSMRFKDNIFEGSSLLKLPCTACSIANSAFSNFLSNFVFNPWAVMCEGTKSEELLPSSFLWYMTSFCGDTLSPWSTYNNRPEPLDTLKKNIREEIKLPRSPLKLSYPLVLYYFLINVDHFQCIFKIPGMRFSNIDKFL